jgi:peptidoglycan/LPS O-acetylase OafA/YrhL
MHQFLLVFAVSAAGALVVATLLASLIGRAGFPLPEQAKRLGCADGLRGYLALSVMLHHLYLWILTTHLGGTWRPPAIPVLNQLGAGGVALFFMTTGLVFYPRILAGLRTTSWITVYITRIFRILPLVTISVAVVVLVIVLRTGASPTLSFIGGSARWISSWAEVPLLGYPDSGRINAYVLWSLKYEWLFYLLLLPLCAAAMDIVRSRGGPSWLVPIALLVGTLAARLAGPSLDVLHYLPLFAVGMLAFEVQRRPHFRGALTKPGVAAAALTALAAGASTTQVPYGASLPLFGFFFICVACGNDLFGLLRTRGARVLGECSFGLYLLHGIVLDLWFVEGRGVTIGAPTVALPVLGVAAAVIVVPLTAITYILIERPAIRLGKALALWVTGQGSQLDRSQLGAAP